MTNINWTILLIFTIFSYIIIAQQCIPNYNLQNILQDQIAIYPISQGNNMQSTATYPFPRTFFTSTPSIISSIDTYQVDSLTEINYFLSIKVNRASVAFTFNSSSMQWIYLRVKFWLTARSDILVGSFILQNITPATQKTYQINIPTSFSTFIDQKSIQLNFITGLKAQTSGDLYQIDVKNAGKSTDGTVFKVTVSSLNLTNIQKIQISYSIFNFQSSYFASGGGNLNYKNIKGSQYKKIHGSFSPIIYLIQGFDKIRLSKQAGINLEFTFDQDYVFETYTGNNFDQIGVVYLSIGQQPSGVCLCDKYIQFDGCVDACPALTYPYVGYAKGGKTCLTCSAKLNQTINQFNTGCNCMDGLQRVDEVCIPKATVLQCTAANTVLSNGVCVCIAGTQSVNNVCSTKCLTNEIYNSTSSKCQCSFGYFNISGSCGLCPTGQVYNSSFQKCGCPQFQFLDTSLNICKCIPNYFNFTGNCVNACPSGYVVLNGTCLIGQKCATNQTFQNGQCVCINTTYIVNGTCTSCPSTTYYNSTSQTCINCLANCAICFNYLSCAECKKDYYYNSTSNRCEFNMSCRTNQTLRNGACDCIDGTYRVADSCTVCDQGTWYDVVSRSCKNCVSNCVTCLNSTSCGQCQNGLTFNSFLGYCVPTCGTNQTLLNGKCECIQGTNRINGTCNKCPIGQFYDSANQGCYQCLTNCISCNSPTTCDRCVDFYVFTISTGTCQPSNCPINQTIINGKCNCIDGTYRVSGTCTVCKSGQFFNNKSEICGSCSQSCIKCSNQATCNQCEPYNTLLNNQCKFNLYDLKSGSPQFTDKFIITDFTTSQPSKNRQITPQQLQQIIKIQLSNKDLTPTQTIIKQNPKNASQVRIIYSFCGNVPLQPFNIKYTFNDPKISVKEDIQNVSYNVLQQKYSNLSN